MTGVEESNLAAAPVLNERCDADIVERALYEVSNGEKTLFFCGHHYAKYEENLNKQEFYLVEHAPLHDDLVVPQELTQESSV